MKINNLKIEGTYLIELDPIIDSRGYFVRTYEKQLFKANNLATNWLQENQSLSKQIHTIRGMHFQKPPYSETKLIRVIEGKILDVFIDLRKNSTTYGKWDSVELSDSNNLCVYIPKGFAHGFCTLTDITRVCYKVDSNYHPDSEGILSWNDPSLGIDWPTSNPFISDKDNTGADFKSFVSPF